MNLFKKLFFIIICGFTPGLLVSQGLNHQWLLGSYNFLQDPKGRILFDPSNYSLINENRKMPFYGAEGNISDNNGNLLMSSNGIWIADATQDTMMNGSDLNPSVFTSGWSNGIPITHINLFLPYPVDSSKYILFHQTLWNTFAPALVGFYKSEIDIALNNGLGAVINKNDTLVSDSLSWGIGACKHANGRDWWIFVLRENHLSMYTFLLTPNGIDTVFSQNLGFASNYYSSASSIVFTQDGKKMACSVPTNQSPSGTILLFDFDRCTGIFSNLQTQQVSVNGYLWGLSFSPSGNFIYSCTSGYVFQTHVNTMLTDTVATYDGFISPPNLSCCATTFFSMYLAANGKIYITSGSGVQHLHEINYPDSAGLACDVQQHSISLGYAQLRAVPNHPNYYLGCDTTSGCPCITTNIDELQQHDFKFSVSPNPTNGNIKIVYLLPQNKKGMFEVYDVNGRKVFLQVLPPWSTLQTILLPELANGIYSCVIESGGQKSYRKIAVVK